MKKGYNKLSFIIIVMMVIFTVLLFIFLKNGKNFAKEFNNLKPNSSNTYQYIYVDENRMALSYFNDYYYYIRNDLEKAYNKLQKEYRLKNFANLEDFNKFINSLQSLKYENYKLEIVDNNYVFHITTDKIKIVFDTKGVLDYEVFFEKI